MTCAAIYFDVQVPLWHANLEFFKELSRNGISGSYGSSNFFVVLKILIPISILAALFHVPPSSV